MDFGRILGTKLSINFPRKSNAISRLYALDV